MIQTKDISLTPGGVRPIVRVSQYDTDRTISLHLDDTAYGTCEIHGTRPDGAKVTQAVTVSSVTRTISWTPSADFTEVDGDVLAEAVFTSGSDRVGTANFILRVEPAGAEADAPGPYDTLTVTAPGTYNVRPYAQVIVDIDAPAGNVDVTENGVYDVSGKSTVRVAVPEPSGTAAITENGRYDVKDKAVAAVNVPVGVFPEGTAEITENGTYNVTDKETARVAVPVGVFPSGKKTVTENGSDIDVRNYEAVDVAVPVGVFPEVTKRITANGSNINVHEYEAVDVAVPVGVFPEGTAAISENGQYDVEQYKTARVNVPVGIFPEGTALIEQNGLYEIEQYEKARVNVQAGIVPEGTLQITANGTYDVTEKAAAVVNVAPDYDALLAGELTEITTQASMLDSYTLYNQQHLAQITAPNLSILMPYCLKTAVLLRSLTIPVGGGWISEHSLESSGIMNLYLPGDEMTELDDVNAFYETPIDVTMGGTGTIHVKASLESAYKNATNWSYYSARIVGDL